MPQLVRENVNNGIKNNDLIVHEEEDLTNAYESHARFFTDIDTSNKAKNKRVLLRESVDHSKYPYPTTQETTLHMDQMVNTKIRLIMFFAAKDGDALYS